MSLTKNKHIIIGTAGHIDHGKTTLIKALTGKSTDRLKEEQERGISIDLGFGYFDSHNGNRYGIVDVPGHERFINNMVAGVVGMDMILLVIAADEGIMPQTREHIDILSLLGVKKAIIVLNKIDLVDNEWLELVESDIRDEFKNTFLKNSPIVKVSSITGSGLDELIKYIESIDVEERPVDSIACLPIDRVFTIKGSGTVVTGTLISGQISLGDELEVFPANINSRIRSIQVHNQSSDIACAGQRVALNLASVDKDKIYRGCVIAEKTSIQPTKIIDVRIKILPSIKRVIKHGSRLHFFSGTSEVLARLILLDKDELQPGQDALAQLRLSERIAIRRDDKFIVRFYSPLETVGGGIVIEANAKPTRRYNQDEILKLKSLESGTIEDNVLAYINAQQQPILTCNELAKMCSVSKEEIIKIVKDFVGKGIVSVYDNSNTVWSNINKEKHIKDILIYLKQFHKKNPYKQGLNKAEIYNLFFNNTKRLIFDEIIEEFVINNIIFYKNEFVYDAEFEIQKDETYSQIEQVIIANLDKAKFNFMWFSDIDLTNFKQSHIEDICVCMEKDNSIIKVADNLYTLPKYISEAKKKIIDVLKKEKRITISQVRDMLDTSRKTAKPILDYMDKIGITKKTKGESEREANNLEADG